MDKQNDSSKRQRWRWGNQFGGVHRNEYTWKGKTQSTFCDIIKTFDFISYKFYHTSKINLFSYKFSE